MGSQFKREQEAMSGSSVAMITNENLELWGEFVKENPRVEFVWLQILSYSARIFTRMVPVVKFTQMMKTQQLLSLPKAAFSLTPGDHLPEGALPPGAFGLYPDLTTVHC